MWRFSNHMLTYVLQIPIEVTKDSWMKTWNENRDKVPGWCEPETRVTLFDIGRLAKGPIVEVGSCFGLSSIYLAAGMKLSRNPNKLICIDPFTIPWTVDEPMDNTVPGYEVGTVIDDMPKRFKKHIEMCDVADQTELIQRRSYEVIGLFEPNSLSAIFIDGDHTYRGIRRDWDLYFPKVATEGLVVFHDTETDKWPGPKRLTSEIDGMESKVVTKLIVKKTLTVYRKNGDLT